MKLTDHEDLIKNGKPTRFGPNWMGLRCGARTRRGGAGACKNPAIKGRSRCKLHGGMSTGAKTSAGLERSREANWKHGRRSRAHVEMVKKINSELRRITCELKRGGWIP